MKSIPLLLLSAVLMGLIGCEAVSTRVSERFSSPVYRTKVVPADQRMAFDAARAALNEIGFRFERGGAAQGRIEAIGPVLPPDGRGTARQRSLDVKLSRHIDGGTEIAVLFSELVEDDFNKRPGEGTITPLKDTPLYEVYFRHIEAALAAKE